MLIRNGYVQVQRWINETHILHGEQILDKICHWQTFLHSEMVIAIDSGNE